MDAPRELRPRKPRESAEPRTAAAASPAVTPTTKKKKAERPKYDVTCIQCGVAAKVPFKPIEGRDIFCQPCYQARRGVVAPAPATDPEMAPVPDQAAPPPADAEAVD